MGLALEANEEVDEAIMAYKKALALNAEAYPAYKQLADIYYLTKSDPTKTIYYYRKFLEYQPQNIDAKGCLGLSLLKTKNYKEGWKYFEYRPRKGRAIEERASKPISKVKIKPLWNGEDIKDKTIYVYSEAGFGDTIMFARYIPILKTKCKKVLFECESGNFDLFCDSDFGVEIFDKNDLGIQLDYDIHTPIMSLPYLLNSTCEKDIPSSDKYLKSDPKKVRIYREKYFKNDKFKIGIKWQGFESEELTRKIKLKSFFKLFNLPNTKFYSLQKDDGIEQLKEANGFEIMDLGSTFKDFADTAAAIENLDLVISNDSSVAHLAAAMGKECWILLPFNQDWRWSMDLSYCPWYKTVKLFKQKFAGNWDDVFEIVLKALVEKIN